MSPLMDIERMWINQPSAWQPLNKLHGTNVLAVEEREGTHRVWFLAGDVVSQQVPSLSLSRGWINQEH